MDFNQSASHSPSEPLGFVSHLEKDLQISELTKFLESVYCQNIGIQLSHINDMKVLHFFYSRLELKDPFKYCLKAKQLLLDDIARIQLFESFCNKKFKVLKRFGIDGCESTVLALKSIIKLGPKLGAYRMVVGLAHRGRINVFANILKKPLTSLFNEFEGNTTFSLDHYDVDIKKLIELIVLPNPSHLETVTSVVLGYTKALQDTLPCENIQQVLPIILHGDASFAGQGIIYETVQMSKLPAYKVGGTIHIIVNNQIGFTTDVTDQKSGQYVTDVMKIVKAPIFHLNADDPESCVRIAELALEYRQAFKSDIILNIIGYRRFGHNELDMPKFTQPHMYQSIDKHPNVLEIYSKRLLKEGVVTETMVDEKKQAIFERLNTAYEKVKMGSSDSMQNSSLLSNTQNSRVLNNHGFFSPTVFQKNLAFLPKFHPSGNPLLIQFSSPCPTGVMIDRLNCIGLSITNIPEWMKLHPTVEKVYNSRKAAIETQKNIDFGLAEALAFGTLISDGYSVRLVGQDVQRGTFSHRHAVLHHQFPNHETLNDSNKTHASTTFCPLQQITSLQESNLKTSNREVTAAKNSHNIAMSTRIVESKSPKFSAYNSLLSEYAALGFEVGYSIANPNVLCVWEAQFGDFVNGAQIIIDQYIASSETKWRTPCGIVLLLPHGYDGQGPEHSSARIERFLQLCDDHENIIPSKYQCTSSTPFHQNYNLQVVNCTTASNFFHVLRRQMLRKFRKPLIVFSPKKILRLRASCSSLNEFGEGTLFQSYIPNVGNKIDLSCQDTSFTSSKTSDSITRLVLCSGQVYYDLATFREAKNLSHVAIGRIEQLSPFPYYSIMDEVKNFPNLKTIVWVQEEPMNMGPWFYVSKRLVTLLKVLNYPNGLRQCYYSGRRPLAAPAVGDTRLHSIELEHFVKHAFYEEFECLDNF
ncbi:2-oxoglutarate dehydrogenase, mitochondrial-like isoform X2 [Hylaeus volcanicus]|uniref:2-oxoglutarate dehydrogenase, mitochondrial-like isoform X2 n=1 Tax=Hylaeus volcanicus TaxID=313075 RepID=UPI0023B79673|nr:2-oxoglutarate dehydrogenase, mitochondrial-like isoform X2 [Hylaeus volcanicus]